MRHRAMSIRPRSSQEPAPSNALPAGASVPEPNGEIAVVLSQVIELSGNGALIGDTWRNGTEMAILDINAAGGILGRPIQMQTYDTGTGATRSTVQRALESDPLALLGPAGTAMTQLVAPLTRD